jgi:hypothetical protein
MQMTLVLLVLLVLASPNGFHTRDPDHETSTTTTAPAGAT